MGGLLLMAARLALMASVVAVLCLVTTAPTSGQSTPGQSAYGQTQVNLEALAINYPGDAGKVRSAIFFGLSLAELPQNDASQQEGIRPIRATASLKKGSEVFDTFEVSADLTTDDLDGRQRLQVYGDLEAPPGSYRLSLQFHIDGLIHISDYPFQLEMPAKDRATVLPPILLDDEGFVAAFFEQGDSESSRDPREPPANYPLFAAGEQLIPDIAPQLGVDVPRSRICLIGRELMDDETFLETGMVGEDGTLLNKERLALVSQDEAENGGYETLCFGLDTQGLTAGLYQLNVTLHDFERRSTERTELSFEILSE